jgi:hypothetical protein
MSLDKVGEALTWLDGTAVIDALDAAVVARTADAFQRRASAPAVTAFTRLDEHRQWRVLRAPEVTRRLLFAAAGPDDTEAFLATAVGVELALADQGSPPAEPSWSALGDVRVGPDGTTEMWPQLTGDRTMALDFGSPQARSIDLSGRFERTSAARPSFTTDQVHAIHRRVAEVMSELAALDSALEHFVQRATCVLVLQIDPDGADHVASGTNGIYIGRSFVTNPHDPGASLDCLAEGIVHEAIHGLLYRESLDRAWVSGDAALEVPRVRSPWTGRALPVRPFLEAAHVWFGLAHLWALGSQSTSFDPRVVRARLARSVQGFTEGPVVDLVRPWWPDIRTEVIERIAGIQAHLLDALAGTS